MMYSLTFALLPFMRVLRSSCSYFTFIYCHFHFLLSFGTRTLIRIPSFSFRKLRKELLRCTFRLNKGHLARFQINSHMLLTKTILKFTVSTKIMKRSFQKDVFYRDLLGALAFSTPLFTFDMEFKSGSKRLLVKAKRIVFSERN